MEEVVLVSGCRTAIGRMGGAFQDFSASDLGAAVTMRSPCGVNLTHVFQLTGTECSSESDRRSNSVNRCPYDVETEEIYATLVPSLEKSTE